MQFAEVAKISTSALQGVCQKCILNITVVCVQKQDCSSVLSLHLPHLSSHSSFSSFLDMCYSDPCHVLTPVHLISGLLI